MHSSFIYYVDNCCLSKKTGKNNYLCKKTSNTVVFCLLSVTYYQMTN